MNRMINFPIILLSVALLTLTTNSCEQIFSHVVESVELDKASMTITEGECEQLTATVLPDNAENQKVIWSTSNASIATVNDGLITAEAIGTAEIIAKSDDGGKTATCLVIVRSKNGEIDYIDEYGVNHGVGVLIGETVWAPVNCGYHETYFKYGKLYQWGRKYGQGYDDNRDKNYSDSFVPTIVERNITLEEGQSQKNKDVFYAYFERPYDWLRLQNDTLWNSGTETYPFKTIYDPCPEGWRVPSHEEFKTLIDNHSPFMSDSDERRGYYFSGRKPYSDKVTAVFLPASGARAQIANGRNLVGCYWCSTCHSDPLSLISDAIYFYSDKAEPMMTYQNRVAGLSVRCVEE